MLEFRILGSFEIVANGEPLTLGGPKQRALLALLLLHRGEAISSDRLIDLLWGERPPHTAASTLRQHVLNLRRTLGADVLLTGGGYRLVPDGFNLDADRFEQLVDQGRQALAAGDAATARELLSSALALWRGEPLADLCYEPFAQPEIARLQEARLAALEERVEADLALGRHRALVAELQALVVQHPHRERLLGQLMLALYRASRHADALDSYQAGRRRLDEELGLEPGPELRRLEQRILDHDPDLEAGSMTGTSGAHAVTAARRMGTRDRLLLAGGGVLLLIAALAAGAVQLAGGSTAIRAAANTVAVIDPHTNRVTGVVAVGARPGAITFASGAVWVANRDDQSISRVDPATLAAVRALPVPDPPTGLAAAGGGVWVASSSSGSSVSVRRVDPRFDVIDATARVGNVVPNTPVAITAEEDRLWVAPFSGELTRLDPQSGRILTAVDPNAGPAGVAVGDGAIWVSDNNADTVTRIDPTGLTNAIAVGHEPNGLAVGAGDVWVADTADDAIVRIDPSTRAVTATITVGAAPMGVAVGDGSVWVANSGDGTVSRIDAHSEKVTATIHLGGSPQQVTVAASRVWVTVDQSTLPAAAPLPSGRTARLEAGYDVDSMDPAIAYTPLSWQLLYATCAKLLNYPDEPGLAGSILTPEVARSLPTRSADGRTYTYTIRPGFRFAPPSDEPVTAQTFKTTIERALNPRMHNPVAAEFDDIVGAKAYMARRATHISGVTASGNTLTVKLTAPAPDLPSRLAQPFFCAVPSDTPIDPKGVRVIPMAGPYTVASYTPGQGIVLVRNPNYHANRPHRLAQIDVNVNIPGSRAVSQVEAGRADYAVDGEVDNSDAATLAARYGPGSPAARDGHQQYFVNVARAVDFLALNTHRPLFSDLKMRLAVNYAIDRAALAQLGREGSHLPEHPADGYLPPDVPGYTNPQIYPLTPDVAKARALAAGHVGQSAQLYTCDATPCDQQAQIIKTDVAAIGLHLEIKAYPDSTLYKKALTPGEPFDLLWASWASDYPDPAATLNLLLESGTIIPTFNSPTYRDRLAAAAKLTGPNRYLTYAKLNLELTRDAAPWIAYGNGDAHDLFSARIGCQTYGVYGIDLAALCPRTHAARVARPPRTPG